MRWSELSRQAWLSIRTMPLKATFIVVAMCLAISSLMVFLQIHQLAQHQMQRVIQKMGPHSFAISFLGSDNRLSHAQLQAIKDNTNMQLIAYQFLPAKMHVRGHELSGQLVALDEQIGLGPIPLHEGAYFDAFDRQEKVLLIGYRLKQEIEQLSLQPVLGQRVALGADLYRIKGVFAPITNALIDFSISQVVAMPLSMGNRFAKEGIDSLWVNANSDSLESAQARLSAKLHQAQQQVYLRSPKDYIGQIEEQARLFRQVLLLVVVIALGSAICICTNVLVSSIYARSKEVGTRLSFGASIGTVIQQIYIEVWILGLVSFFLAALISSSGTYLLCRSLEWQWHLGSGSIIVGFIVACLLSTVLVSWPLYRLTRQAPSTLLATD